MVQFLIGLEDAISALTGREDAQWNQIMEDLQTKHIGFNSVSDWELFIGNKVIIITR